MVQTEFSNLGVILKDDFQNCVSNRDFRKFLHTGLPQTKSLERVNISLSMDMRAATFVKNLVYLRIEQMNYR